jgi:hypothetical protein
VLASYGVVGPLTSANAASLTGSHFEIDTDANLVVDGSSPAIDWLAGGSGSDLRDDVHVKSDRPTGTLDDSFTQGTNINDTPTTITTGSIPNNKSDLKKFGIYLDKQPSETYVNLFWTRVQAPSGTTTMDFELNQSQTRENDISPPKNPDVDTHTIPLRTTGDILITYYLESSGDDPVLTKRTWNGSAWGAVQAFSASDALASINSSAISAAASDGVGPLDPFTFGEASVKLSALIPASDTCITFGSMYLRSRSSATDTDENKDFIAPEPVTISNCGSVRIHKTDAHGALADAVFTLYKDVAPLGGSRGAEDTTAAGSCQTNASGDCTITDVKKGSYWVVETTVPAGHDAAPNQYATITTGDQVVSLSFNDPIQHGTITIIKNAVPDDAQDFSFTLDGDSFQLDDDADATLPSSRSFQVEVGTHTAVEVGIPSGWVNTGLSCVDPSGGTTTSLGTHTATISVAKDETVTCTYTNTFTTRAVNLQTSAVEVVGNTSWNDRATVTGDGTHPVTGTVTFFACDPQPTATACTTGGTQVGVPVAVSHVSGSTYGATTSTPYVPDLAGWSCFRAAFVSTSAYYLDDTHTNATTECFLKQNADLTVSKTAVPAFGRLFEWSIAKDVDKTRVEIADGDSATFHYTVTVAHTSTDSAWTVTGLITVNNPNPVDVTGVTVSDAIDNGAGSCVVTGGVDATVPAGDSATFPYVCTYTSAPSPLAGTNTATATWDAGDFFTPHGTASGTAGVDFAGVVPTVTNPVVTVSDTMQGALGAVDGRDGPGPAEFSYDVVKSGVAGTCTDYPNTASFTTGGEVPVTGSASKLVTVCVGGDLTPSITAEGSYDRADLWLIDKSVDQTRVNLTGGSATFTYTVKAQANGVVDSGWTLGGTVHVDNPNDWTDAAVGALVSTDLGGGAVCTLEGGTVPASSGIDLPFTCAFTSQPAYTGQVWTTVSWDPAELPSPHSEAVANTEASLTQASETDKVVTVVDDKTDPANPVQLGTADFADGVTTFTYQLTKPAPVGVGTTCVDYTNVAVIVETEQSDTQVVTVCSTFTGGGGGGPVVTPPQGGGLPFTGDLTWLLFRSALALLFAGLVLLLVSRRRPTSSS